MNACRRPLLLPAAAWLLGDGLVLNGSGAREVGLSFVGLLLMGFLCPISEHAGHSYLGRLRRPSTLLIVVVSLISGGVVAEYSVHRWRQTLKLVAYQLDRDGGAAFEGVVRGGVRQRYDGSLSFRLQVSDSATVLRIRLRGEATLERRRLLTLLPGDRVGLWGNPHIPANLRHARPSERPRGADLNVSLKSAGLVVVLERGRPWPARLLATLQNKLAARLNRQYPSDPVAREVLSALLLGRRGSVGGTATKAIEDLRKAGVGHLLAISGLHVGWIAGLVILMIARPRRPLLLRCLLLFGSVLGFALLVGPTPSVQRAAAFFLTSYLAMARGRRGDPLNTLSCWASVFVILDPWILIDVGFQLTFVATAAIVGGAPELSRRLPGPATLRLPLAVSLVSYGATAPLVALHFARLTPVGILANLLAVPLAMLATATGYVSLLHGPIGNGAAAAAGMTVQGMVLMARMGGALPYSVVEVSMPNSFLLLPIGGIVLYWIWVGGKGSRGRAFVAAIALAALHIGGPPGAAPLARHLGHAATAHILDVGQGQAIVLADDAGRTMVFDAPGGDPKGTFPAGSSARVVLPWLRRRGVRQLQVLAVSHGHLDHAGGLPFLIDRFQVEELWLPPGWHRSGVMLEAAATVRARGGAVRHLSDHEEASMGTLLFQGLHGGRPAAGTNEGSLGLILRDPGPGLLIPGDLGIPTEDHLLTARTFGKVDLLVAGHHGSRHSSGQKWLATLAPRQIAVSCGYENRFGHPHTEFLDRVRQIQATLRRTDHCGTLSYVLRDVEGESVWHPIPSTKELREGCNERQGNERDDEHPDGGPGQSSTTR